jgi:hypothetical protein
MTFTKRYHELLKDKQELEKKAANLKEEVLELKLNTENLEDTILEEEKAARSVLLSICVKDIEDIEGQIEAIEDEMKSEVF